jgi:hypothetical protein
VLRTVYFFCARRGVLDEADVDEADVYAVDADHADDWLRWFSRHLSGIYHAGSRISRREADRLIRLDGIILAIEPDDYDAEVCRSDRLLPGSIASAKAFALALRADWKSERELLAAMVGGCVS